MKPKSKRRTYYKKKPYTKKALTNAIVKTHRKLEPSKEIRYVSYAALTGFTTTTAAFQTIQLSGTITQGTSKNQKEHDKIYVPGFHLEMALNNLDLNSAKMVRIMVVRNKNPADTLDTVTYGDLFENENFGPEATPLSHGGTAGTIGMPINTDIVKVYYDKTYMVPSKAQRSVFIKKWIPLKAVWTYKTVLNQTNVSNGNTYLIVQSLDLGPAFLNSAVDMSLFGRLFWKPYETLRKRS